MIFNSSNPDVKRPRTYSGGVAGLGGDARKDGRVQKMLPQQKHLHNLHHHMQHEQMEGEDLPIFLPESAFG